MKKRLILLFFGLVLGQNLFAATLTWTGTTSTNWATPTNWSTGNIPTASDDIIINSTPSNQPSIGTAALANSVEVQTGATLTISAAGSLTINGNKTFGSLTGSFFNYGTVQNNGQLTIGSTAAGGASGLLNAGTFNNNAGANINIDRSTDTGLNNNGGGSGSTVIFNNAGTIIIGALASVGSAGLANGRTFNNIDCGKIIIKRQPLLNYIGSIFNNGAYVQVDNTLTNEGTFRNNGVLVYGTLGSGSSIVAIVNNGILSVIINNNPSNTTIFTYGNRNLFTNFSSIDGIFTDLAATASAGTYTYITDTFVPSTTLPSGSQTLYVKMSINSTCSSLIVPFTYTGVACTIPIFTLSSIASTTCGGTNGSLKLSGLTVGDSYLVNVKSGGVLVDEFTETANASGEISKSNLVAADYVVKATVGTCVSSTMTVNVADPTSTLATATTSYTASVSGTVSKRLVTSACNVIANLLPNGANPVAGNVDAKVWVQTTQPSGYVKRHYEITPTSSASTATGRITLYFKQAEFTDFNNQSPAPARLLPTGPTDVAGIANVLVFKRGGTSSDGSGLPSTYSGALTTINPNDGDVVWNATESCWEISFNVTGFSGFVIGTPPPGCTLPNITTEPVGASLCLGQGINLNVVASNVTNYQWELNGIAIFGATSSTYTVPVAADYDLGNYTVRLENGTSTCAVRSRMAIVESKVSHFMQMVGCNCGGNSDVKVFINGGTSPYSFDYQSTGGPITVNNYNSATVITLNPRGTQGRAISATDASGCKSIAP